MSDLNVFHYGMIKKPKLRGVFANIKQFFRNCKYAWQRATRGYCDWDAWDLDYYYGELIIQSLRHLRDHTHSYPGKGQWDTPEQWEQYLTDIITHLEHYVYEEENEYYKKADILFTQMLSESDVLNKEKQREQWLSCEERSYTYREAERKTALAMLDKCWNDLWD